MKIKKNTFVKTHIRIPAVSQQGRSGSIKARPMNMNVKIKNKNL